MASMFIGEYSHSVDIKGRVIVPAKFREALGETFMVTMGVDGCLSMYSNEEWNDFVDKLRALPEGRKETRQILRHFLARATVCEVDKQGRILIPAKLREHAGLLKDIVFVGVLSKVEIWSRERWDENESSIDDVDDITEKLSELGIDF